MTGKYPASLHLTDWSPGMMPDNPKLLVPDWTKHLLLEEITLAEIFQQAGYATACPGKRHLGDAPFYPEKQGLEINLGGSEKAAPTSFHSPYGIPNLPEGPSGEYLTDRLGREVAERIAAWKDRPFFLYLSHFAVHTPIQGRKDLLEKYRLKLGPGLHHQNVQYAAMIRSHLPPIL